VQEVYRLLKQGPKTRNQIAEEAIIQVPLPIRLSNLLIVVLHHMVERGKITRGSGGVYHYIIEKEDGHEGQNETVRF
jgi:hypothetical protein